MAAPHLQMAFAAGPYVFLSGQLAFGDKGQISGSPADQTTRCLERLEQCLSDYGLDRKAIVKATIFLVDKRDFASCNQAYAGFFGEHKPTRSTVVCDLVMPGALVEIEAVALLSHPAEQ